ncbi:hypothetical protein [Dyella sp.]|uniref:hypothetical protein n=1 Tax=Dyella sp. TaxID=1869338 RepID=UPI002ED3B629
MFGWFNSSLMAACSRMQVSHAHRRWLGLSAVELVGSLPLLGSVLYVSHDHLVESPASALSGWLVERAELAPLMRTQVVAAVSDISVEGPREWLECHDVRGTLLARLFLLPDTDYLAWDALLAQGAPLPRAPWRHIAAPRCVAAWPIAFRHRRMAGLTVLGAVEVRRLSALGRSVAVEVAREAGIGVP